MKKTTIKSKIFIGFLLLTAISVILYGCLSWFARGYVLDGTKKIKYNSSLAKQIEKLRVLSDEKILVIYRGIHDKKDISTDIAQIDQEINAVCNNISSDINTLGTLRSNMAAGDVQNLISSILDKESNITQSYDTLIKPGITGTYEERLLFSASDTMERWNDFIQSVMVLSDDNLITLKALLNNLENKIDRQNQNAASIKAELEAVLVEAGKVNASLSDLSLSLDKYFEESQNALNTLNSLLYNAAGATELPAVNKEDIPYYNHSTHKDALIKDKNAVINGLNSLISQGNKLATKLNLLVSGHGNPDTGAITDVLEQRSLLTEIILSAQEIKTLAVLSSLSKDRPILEQLINEKLPEIREKTESIENKNSLDLSKLDAASSSLEELLSVVKDAMADGKGDGINKINSIRKELLPLVENLDYKLQTDFDENIVRSGNIEKYIIPGLIIMSAVSILFGILIAFIVSNSIIKPIKQMSGQLKKLENGDFKSRIRMPSDPDLSQMAKSVNALLETREQIINETASVSENIERLRKELLGSFMNNKELLNDMADVMQKLLDRFKTNRVEINETDILDSVELDAAVSREVLDSTEKSRKAVQDAKDTIIKASETVRDIAQQIERLEGSSGKIEEITDTITQIAKRTNLLALNAAIEAAKAGDQGRGFAVLADEIRKLADASGEAAKAIKSQLNDIQVLIQSTVENMDKGVSGVEQGAESISGVYQSIDDITSRVKQVVSTLEDYAQKSNKQLMANQKLMNAIESINKSTSELYEAGKSVDDKLVSSRQSISNMKHIEEMLDMAYSKLYGILNKYKGKS
ncbi:MAG: HAMP domain-containing protein [Clostridiaceae bacterium]|nr:HAMP domain-containing protein [Clostridiaceae bacterium]